MNRKLRNFLITGISTVIVAVIINYNYHSIPSWTQQTASSVQSVDQNSLQSFALGSRTKTSGCIIHGELQDSACTPGQALAGVTKDQICTPGYAKSVRNVPESEKNEVYAEYGITHHINGEYEVDHLVSLELGGSNDISNLWPEAADPVPGFHQKDVYENYLHEQVCNGILSLQEAQYKIAIDWYSNWKHDMNVNN